MTSEEAIRELKIFSGTTKTRLSANFWKALEMAIKALEQEPCEDAVSRRAALEVLKDKWNMFSDANDAMQESIDTIEALSNVTPQLKTGHWIEGRSDNPNIHNILCSRCFEGYPSKGHANSQYTKEKFKWCPKCGARMVEPQERSGEE